MEIRPDVLVKENRCELCGSQRNVGSITSWIFRSQACKCNSNHLKEALKVRLTLREITGAPLDKCSHCGLTIRGLSHDCPDESFQKPTPAELSLIGHTVNQKYEIIDFTGRGGMSVVYRARHLFTEQDVALKLLRSHLLSDPNSVERFQREAMAVSSLSHKNIIKMFDFGITDDDQPFIAVEFLTGTPLADLVKNNGPVSSIVAINWFCQIADALKDAHQSGIIHRDIKPSNVIAGTDRDGSETVKILDFGISKILFEDSAHSKLTQTGEIFGSPMYMSPEQCRGERLDERSDIYSFGTLMYETLTGAAPLLGENVLDTLNKQLSIDPTPVIEVAPSVSEGLNYVVMRCLEKEPSKRFQSADELLSDLKLLKQGKTPKYTKKKGTSEQQDRSFQKQRGSILFACACVVVFLISSALGYLLVSETVAKKEKIASQTTNVSASRLKALNTLVKPLIDQGHSNSAVQLLRNLINFASSALEKAEYQRQLGRLVASSDRQEGLRLYGAVYEVCGKMKNFPSERPAFLRDYASILRSAGRLDEAKAIEQQLALEISQQQQQPKQKPTSTKITPLPKDVAALVDPANYQHQKGLKQAREYIGTLESRKTVSKRTISILRARLAELSAEEQRVRKQCYSPRTDVLRLNTAIQNFQVLLHRYVSSPASPENQVTTTDDEAQGLLMRK